MSLVLNDIVKVTWRASAYNQEFQFQQTYRILTADAGTGTLASLFGIASYFAGDMAYGGPSTLSNAWLNMLGTGIKQYAVDCQKLIPAKTIYIRKEAAASGTGGSGSAQTNTCGVFSLVSGVPGRSQIAKFHVGPLPDSFAVNGSLSTGALTNLRALASACVPIQTLQLAAPGDTTLQPIILHRNPNANPRYADVSTYRFNFYVRSQRRRTIGVGK